MVSFLTTQLLALQAFYNHFQGSSWTWNQNTGNQWDFNSTPCNVTHPWQGITCNDNDGILIISLSETNLIGSIDGILTLTNLTDLQYLDLYNNKITGTLPSSIDTLTSLVELDVNDNSLVGSLPSALGNMINMSRIILYNNYLTGYIPTSITNLIYLDTLDLSNNLITGTIPSSIGSLSSLRLLYLHENQIFGTIPSSIGNIPYLSNIYLEDNQLSGSIPSSIGNLTNLIELLIHNNKLTGTIPSTLGNMYSLSILYINNNQLTGSLPSSIGILTELVHLHLFSNQLTGFIPSDWLNLTIIDTIYINNNLFSGTIPSSLGVLYTLRILDIDNNHLTGSLPSNLGDISSLESFYLYNNYLTGTLPATMYQLTQLTSLYLSSNNFHGPLDALNDVNSLKKLYLNDNMFTGSISFSFTFKLGLLYLDLNNNNLNGSLPDGIGQMSNLEYIDLSQNEFTGSIPLAMSTMNNLQYLDLHLNSFTGNIGLQICNLPHVTYLSIINNNFTCFDTCLSVEINDLTSLNHCYGTIDTILCEIETNSKVSQAIDRKPLSSSLFQVSSGSRTLTFADRYEYHVSISNAAYYKIYFSLLSEVQEGLYICEDDSCESTLKRYIGNAIDNDWPINSNGSLTIQSSEFYFIMPKLDFSTSFYASPSKFEYGFLAYVTAYVSDTGWNCSIYNETHLYAEDYCSWSGITCQYYTTVTEIDLGGFVLTGTIPSVLGSLTSLTYLSLASNNLEGTIPHSLTNLTDLKTLDISSNFLTGTIPDSLFSISTLHTFSASLNQLNGTIPDLISGQDIYLRGNFIGGKASQEVCEIILETKTSIYLQENHITCYEPCWESIKDLYLDDSVENCAPTSMPSSMPSARPTVRPKPQANSFFTPGIISGITIAGFVAILSVFVNLYYFRRKHAKLHHSIEGFILIDMIKNKTKITAKDIDKNIKELFGFDISEFFKYALDSEHNKDIIELSLVARMIEEDIEFQQHVPHDQRKVSWWEILIQFNTDFAVKIVGLILEHFKSNKPYIDMLIDGKDLSERNHYDAASPRCQMIMKRYKCLLGRYEIRHGPPIHISLTSMVVYATDYGNTLFSQESTKGKEDIQIIPVVIKFIKDHDLFLREISFRKKFNFDPNSVISTLDSYDGTENLQFKNDLRQHGIINYDHCIVMTAGGTSLRHILLSQNIVGENWDEIKRITKDISKALAHIHSCGVMHGDIKPDNIVASGQGYKLIDFDAACPIVDEKRKSMDHGNELDPNNCYAGRKYSSGYLPPEMFYYDENTKKVGIRKPITDGDPNKSYDMVSASEAIDMWAFGVVLYYACTGMTLFQTSVDENINEAFMNDLRKWSTSTKTNKLKLVDDKYAMDLLSMLLNRDPKLRPSAERVLTHPFLTGKFPIRLQNEDAEYDVFISYRVATEKDLANLIFDLLTSHGVKVWLDTKCLRDGERWEEGFIAGLMNTKIFLCLTSKKGMQNEDPDKSYWNFSKLSDSSTCDNVLLEWRLAVELKERNLLKFVFPVFIQSDASQRFLPNLSIMPEVIVESIEEKTIEHFSTHGLGNPFSSLTVKEIVQQICSFQGYFIEMGNNESLYELETKVKNMLATFDPMNHNTSNPLEGFTSGKTHPNNTNNTIMSTEPKINIDLNNSNVKTDEENQRLKDEIQKLKQANQLLLDQLHQTSTNKDDNANIDQIELF